MIETQCTVSGHGLEEEGLDHASTKADGKDGGQWSCFCARAHTGTTLEIVCADGKPILDHVSSIMSME